MKLIEIRTITSKDISTKQSEDTLPTLVKNLRMRHDVNFKQIGSGYFATAHSHKDEPGTVRKVVKGTIDGLKHDAYFKYLIMLAKKGRMEENPYFPKVYNIELYRTRTGRFVYAVDMERLHHLDSTSPEDLTALKKRMFHSAADTFQQRLRIKEQTPRNQIIFLINDVLVGRLPETLIKDSYLRHAIKLLKQMVTTKGTEPDIHDENIMLRKSPFGSQLVFSDPLA